jgi:hypothetical protein
MNFQHVYSSYLVVRAAGLVEFAVTEILAAYAAQHHSPEVQNFVRRALSYENSLNCQKIEKIFGRFSGLWWPGIRGMTSEEQRAAVDSLKTLRDQFAHGQTNGTGYAIVETYYARAKEFVRNMSDFLLP